MSDSSGRFSPVRDGCTYLLTSYASQRGLLLAGVWVQDCGGLSSPCILVPDVALCGCKGYCQKDLEHIKSDSGGKNQRHGGTGVFILNSAGEVEGLNKERIDSTSQQVTAQLLSTTGIWYGILFEDGRLLGRGGIHLTWSWAKASLQNGKRGEDIFKLGMRGE